LIDNVKKLAKFGTSSDETSEKGPEATNASRLRLRIKLISDEPKSLAAMLAELRNITENLDTATLILAMKNLIRLLNENADLTTSDHFAFVQLTAADKLDKYILEHLLRELLQEAAVRLQQTTPDSQETIGKLILPEVPEVIDRV
jgi:Glu-tRNA(Gln) amidotransferase subunit E-like FAD-binding protein